MSIDLVEQARIRGLEIVETIPTEHTWSDNGVMAVVVRLPDCSQRRCEQSHHLEQVRQEWLAARSGTPLPRDIIGVPLPRPDVVAGVMPALVIE